MIMRNIQDIIKTDDKSRQEEAYKNIKKELEFHFHDQAYHASHALHEVIQVLWLLPETPAREALREKLYELSDSYDAIFDNELKEYEKEWETNK